MVRVETWCRVLPVLNFLGKNMKKMYQHAESEWHREKVKLRGKDRNQLLAQHSLGLLSINQKVAYVDDIEKGYQCSGLVASIKIIFLLINLYKYYNVGYKKVLVGLLGPLETL